MRCKMPAVANAPASSKQASVGIQLTWLKGTAASRATTATIQSILFTGAGTFASELLPSASGSTAAPPAAVIAGPVM